MFKVIYRHTKISHNAIKCKSLKAIFKPMQISLHTLIHSIEIHMNNWIKKKEINLHAYESAKKNSE
jgi:hypothetical protein